jgi:RNA polymerase sigma-70 factor (ECF subfamily)
VLRRTPDPLAHPERLAQSVYAYVAYRIGSGPDAEDATSEVFARALRYRSKYDSAKGTPIAWLTGIARRVLAERVAVERSTLADVPDVAAPGALEEESVNRITMQRAVATLGERDRELVALR